MQHREPSLVLCDDLEGGMERGGSRERGYIFISMSMSMSVSI